VKTSTIFHLEKKGLNYNLPFFMPEFRDKFVVALTESRLLVGSDEAAAVQEELCERRTEGERTTVGFE